MDNLLKKTEKLRREKQECLKETRGFSRIFKCVSLFFRELGCALRYLPHFIKDIPYNGFSTLSSRDEKGTYQISYSNYLRYKKFSLASVTIILLILGISTSLFVFNVHPNKVLAAPTPCAEPYTVTRKTPSTNTLCVGDTISTSGYWRDANAGGTCPTGEPYTGQICNAEMCAYTTVNTSSALKTSSGTYTGVALENLDGNTSAAWSKTLTANTTGIWRFRFKIDRLSGAPLGSYYSAYATITISDVPNWEAVAPSHSSNTASSITWTWTDRSNEDNYRVQDTGNNNKSGDLAADVTSWQESSGLSANTQYTRYVQAENTCGTSNSANGSAYTSIESPTGISFDLVAQTAITISGEGTISNLATGGSGIKFSESVSASDSGWLQTNTWEKSSLTANTQYTFDAQTRNGDSDENSAIAGVNKYTLAADASVSGDETENVWTNATTPTFTNDTNFGAGGVEYYRYVFDKNATHTFNDTETQWTTGTQGTTATSEGDWYIHAKAYNGDDVAGSSGETTTLGPYKVDITIPTITNNVTGDSAWLNTSGTTYDVDFLSGGGSPLDYAQYAIGSSQGGNDVISWTNIFTDDIANHTSSWPVDFSNLDEGTNYVSFRTYDKAGNLKSVTDDGFTVNKDTVPATPSDIEIDTTVDTATITWTTNEATTTQVAWGTDDSYGNLTTEDTNLTTEHSITISGLNDNTTYYFDVLGDDRADNETSHSGQSFATSELEPTVITGVQVTEISETSVSVTWTTNHAADSKVRYGLTTAYGQEVYKSALVTSHEITLTGLTAGATYHYEVLSTGNTTTYDADATFTTEEDDDEEEEVTLAAPTIISPADGSTIGEQRPTITGLSRSNNTIFIFIDGELENTILSTTHSSGTGSFAYTLRRNLSNGEHTLHTIARNAEGVYSGHSTAINFIVDIPFVTPHLNSSIFSNGDNPKVTITGLAFNNSTIKVYLDGEYLGEFKVTNNETSQVTSFAYEIPLQDIISGSHIITTVAYDPNGRSSGTSNAVNFEKKTVTNKPTQAAYEFEEGVKYTVVSGDSLWKIAESFYGCGADYPKIVEANKEKYPSFITNPNFIQIGWYLLIP